MMCGRVLIMLGGRVLASDTPENLQLRMAGGSHVVAEIAAPPAALQTLWDEHPDVEECEITDGDTGFQRCVLTPRAGVDIRSTIFALVRQHGWDLRELTRNRYTLEDIYLQVTKPSTEETE